METVTFRVRSLVWFVTGAMLATAVTLMFVNAWRVDAAPGDVDSTFVPITPCRLIDTRQTGIPSLVPSETRTLVAHGTNGDCTIPTEAVGLSLNVTADGASAVTFLTIWPSDKPKPLASSLNPAPGQPAPNAVTTPLSPGGEFNVFNFAGTVDVIFDVVGYYTKSSLADLDDRVAAAEVALTAVAGRIATNEADIATNTNGVATNATDVQSLDAREPFAVAKTESVLVVQTLLPTAVVSVSVTAPVAGQVTVNSTAIVVHLVDGGDVLCAIFEDAAIPAVDIPNTTPSLQLWETSGGGDSGTFPVAGSSTLQLVPPSPTASPARS